MADKRQKRRSDVVEHRQSIEQSKNAGGSPWKSCSVWIGRIIFFVAIYFVCAKLLRTGKDIPIRIYGVDALAEFVLLLAISFVFFLLAALQWKILLFTKPSVKISFPTAVYITAYSQIAKYLPGNIFQFVSKVLLSQRQGASKSKSISCLAVETVLYLCASVLIFLTGILLSGKNAYIQILSAFFDFHYSSTWPVALMCLTGVVVSIVFLCIFSKNVRNLSSYYFIAFDLIANMQVFGIACITFLGYGLVSYLIEGFFFPPHKIPFMMHVAGFSIAWVLGMITPGAPGGLGVREMLLILLYSPLIGEPKALGLTVILRMLSIVTEILFFILGWMLKPGTLSPEDGSGKNDAF